jgi:hypothetical protein
MEGELQAVKDPVESHDPVADISRCHKPCVASALRSSEDHSTGLLESLPFMRGRYPTPICSRRQSDWVVILDRIGKLDKTKDASTIAAGRALTAKLTAVEGEIYQYRNRGSRDPLNYPIRLNYMLAALAGTVGSADTRPTDSSYQVFKELSSRPDEQRAALDSIVRIDFAAFDRSSK